jgi:ABC-type Fe3+/spermidine/putrescine transport system ATPase subunit
VIAERSESQSFLELDGVSRRFEKSGTPAVAGVSISIERGEIFALLGPSGCGKSTTLRIIAGLEQPDSGAVRLRSEDVTQWPPERRRMGVVFQNYALFPHLSVFENVAFGLRVRKEPKSRVDAAVAEALELVQLSGLERRGVDQLSGGQQQRVALARAIAPRPEVVLLDEPLSNLDAALREETRDTLRVLLRKLGVTAVFVTHDQSEALAFADRLGLMRSGHLVEVGPPDRLYNEPEVEFTATFLGGANVLQAIATGDARTVRIGTSEGVRINVGSWADGLREAPAGQSVALVARPELVALSDEPVPGALPGRLVDRVFLGATYRVTVALEAGPVLRAIARRIPTSADVWLSIPPEAARAVVPDTRIAS